MNSGIALFGSVLLVLGSSISDYPPARFLCLWAKEKPCQAASVHSGSLTQGRDQHRTEPDVMGSQLG